jgi:hypothetical protein
MKALALGLLFLASPAFAQLQCTTLVYQGAPLTLTATGSNPPSGPTSIIGMVSLGEGGLPANVTNLNATIFWDFTATFFGLNQEVYTGGTFLFTTNNEGTITAWNFTLGYQPAGATIFTATSTQNGDSMRLEGDTSLLVGTNTIPGTWTCLPNLTAQAGASQAQVTSLQYQLQLQTYYHAYWQDAWVTTELALERAEAKK